MSIARRDFLKTVGGASLAGSLLGAGSSSLSLADDSSDALFGFAEDRVPMNAANLCPMPSAVTKAVQHYGAELDRDLSHPNRQRIEALKEDARERIATLLGVTADELAITRNTSEANNTIVQGFPLHERDEVLLWDQNHPSNSIAWEVAAARSGGSVRRMSVSVNANSVDEVVSSFVDAISPKTRVVAFTHISNITGFRLPAQEICSAVKQKGDIYVHIDGAQTWGIADVNLAEFGCDSFSGSSHKWFMGPRETGLLYVSEGNIERLWPNVVSVPWGDELQTSLVGARKFEAMGQRDDAALAALGEAAALHESITPAGIERQANRIAGHLREGLADLGVPFVSPRNPQFASNVIILSATRENARLMVSRVFEDSGVITAPVNGFRMSPHIYNTDEHVDRVLASVAKSRQLLS